MTYLSSVRCSHEVDMVLLLPHASHVLLQAGQVAGVVAGLEPEQLREAGLIWSILYQSQLDAGPVLLPELLVDVSLHLLEHVQGLTYQLLLDHLQQLVLLEGLTRNVQGEVIRINLRGGGRSVCVCV